MYTSDKGAKMDLISDTSLAKDTNHQKQERKDKNNTVKENAMKEISFSFIIVISKLFQVQQILILTLSPREGSSHWEHCHFIDKLTQAYGGYMICPPY